MNNDLKQFMEKTFPTGTKIKIDRAANDDIVGKTFIVDSIDNNDLHGALPTYSYYPQTGPCIL